MNEDWTNNYTFSRFYRYFAKVIDELKDCYWIIDRDGCCLPIELIPDDEEEKDLVEECILKQDEDDILLDYEGMKKLAPYIRDDWNVLICYRGKPSDFRHILMFTRDVSLNQYEVRRINKELECTQIEACLYNDDSVLWGMICDKSQYIQLVKDELKGIEGQMIEDVLPDQSGCFLDWQERGCLIPEHPMQEIRILRR